MDRFYNEQNTLHLLTYLTDKYGARLDDNPDIELDKLLSIMKTVYKRNPQGTLDRMNSQVITLAKKQLRMEKKIGARARKQVGWMKDGKIDINVATRAKDVNIFDEDGDLSIEQPGVPVISMPEIQDIVRVVPGEVTGQLGEMDYDFEYIYVSIDSRTRNVLRDKYANNFRTDFTYSNGKVDGFIPGLKPVNNIIRIQLLEATIFNIYKYARRDDGTMGYEEPFVYLEIAEVSNLGNMYTGNVDGRRPFMKLRVKKPSDWRDIDKLSLTVWGAVMDFPVTEAYKRLESMRVVLRDQLGNEISVANDGIPISGMVCVPATGLVTVTCGETHRLMTGDRVYFKGVDVTSTAGVSIENTWFRVRVLSATQFSFIFAGILSINSFSNSYTIVHRLQNAYTFKITIMNKDLMTHALEEKRLMAHKRGARIS